MTQNKEATRYYSNIQEQAVCKALNAFQQSNSGAGHFRKGDCVNKKASILIECKTVMKEKNSVSIKNDWIIKNRKEAFSQRLNNTCIAFNFKPQGENYYIIDERLMRFLIDKLSEY